MQEESLAINRRYFAGKIPSYCLSVNTLILFTQLSSAMAFSQTELSDLRAIKNKNLLAQERGVPTQLPKIPKYQLNGNNDHGFNNTSQMRMPVGIPDRIFSPPYWTKRVFRNPLYPEVD